MGKKSKEFYIQEIFSLLNDKDKKIVELFHGFNGNEKFSFKEISEKLRVSKEYAEYIVEDFNSKVAILEKNNNKKLFFKARNDDYYQVEAIDEKKQKIIDKMSSSFFNMFEGYSDIKIEKALNYLYKNERRFIFLYYGLDGIHCLDYDEIAENYRVSVDSINRFIESGIIKVKKILKEGIVEGKEKNYKENKYEILVDIYGQKIVDEAISIFDYNRQNIIRDYFNSKEKNRAALIAKKYNVSTTFVYNLSYNSINRIEAFIKKTTEGCTKEDFYSNFKDYNTEDVNRMLNLIDNNKREIIDLYYDLNNKHESLEYIVKTFNISEAKVYKIIDDVIRKIKLKIDRNKDIDLNKFYGLFEGFSKEKVDESLNILNNDEKDILFLYYGLNGILLRKKEINKIYPDLSYLEICKTIDIAIRKIKKNLGIKMDKTLSNSSHVSFFQDKKYIELENEYDKKKIEDALTRLDKKEREIIELYYVLKNDEGDIEDFLSKIGISKEYFSTTLKKAFINLESLIKNPSFNFSQVNELETVRKKGKTMLFYEKFEGYCKKEIDDALSKLKENNQMFIKDYFGLNDKILSIKELSKKYGYKESSVRNKLSFLTKKIRDLLIGKENQYISNNAINEIEDNETFVNKKKEKFYNRFKEFSKEEVDSVILCLSDRQKKVIFEYYLSNQNITLKEFAKKYGYGERYIYSFVTSLFKSIDDKLKKVETGNTKESKKEKFYKKFEGFSISEVDNAVATLREDYQNIVRDYYGLNTEELSLEEVAIKYNKNKNNMSVWISNLTKKIKKILENKVVVKETKSKKDEFYKHFEGYGEEQVNSTFSRLNDKTKTIIEQYYGLNAVPLSKKEIARLNKISISGVTYTIDSAFTKIKLILENPKLDFSVKNNDKINKEFMSKKERFYKKFEGYSEEKVNESLSKLNDKEKEIIQVYFGLVGEGLSLEKMALKYNRTINSMNVYISVIVKKIRSLLENPKLDFSFKKRAQADKKVKGKKERFYKNFKNYDEEEINEAIERLSLEDKEIIALYYGMGEECLSIGELCNKYGKKKNLMFSKLYYINNKVDRLLKNKELNYRTISSCVNKEKVIRNKKEEFYKFFAGYSEEEINDAINRLDSKRKDIVSMYYGIGCEACSRKQVGEKFQYTPNYVSVILNLIKQKIKDLLEKKEMVIEEKEEKKKKFYDLFDSYEKKDVDEVLLKLNSRDQEIINLYYGLNGEKLSSKEISVKFNLSVQYLFVLVRKNVNMIKELLDNPDYGLSFNKKNMYKIDGEFFNLFKGYSKVKIFKALESLNAGNKEFLCCYYGINCEKYSIEDLIKKYGIDENSVKSILDYSILKIKEILMNENKPIKYVSTRGNRFKKFILLYGEDVVIKVVSQLDQKEKTFISMYYNICHLKNYSLVEISNKVGIDKNEFSSFEERILNKIEPMLRPMLIKMKKEEFKGLIVDRKNLLYINEILNKGELKLIFAYYGLNGKDIITKTELCEKLNISSDNLEKNLKNIIDKINRYIPSAVIKKITRL